jgi:hypothetical protein
MISPNRTSLDYAFWEAIQAFEEAKSQAAGRKIRLGYTRRMVKAKGIAATLEGWALGKETEGFDTLMELGMPELTGEAGCRSSSRPSRTAVCSVM